MMIQGGYRQEAPDSKAKNPSRGGSLDGSEQQCRSDPCQTGIGPVSHSYHLIFYLLMPVWSIATTGAGAACRRAAGCKYPISCAYGGKDAALPCWYRPCSWAGKP